MASDPNCVFCKIVAGAIPGETVLETEDAIAFLDIGPLAEGHLLLVPREHYERLDTMPGERVARVCRDLPRLGTALCQVTACAGYNVLQNNGRVAGQAVGHVHFHLIPRVEGDGLGYRWHPKTYPPGRARELAEQLKTTLDVRRKGGDVGL